MVIVVLTVHGHTADGDHNSDPFIFGRVLPLGVAKGGGPSIVRLDVSIELGGGDELITTATTTIIELSSYHTRRIYGNVSNYHHGIGLIIRQQQLQDIIGILSSSSSSPTITTTSADDDDDRVSFVVTPWPM